MSIRAREILAAVAFLMLGFIGILVFSMEPSPAADTSYTGASNSGSRVRVSVVDIYGNDLGTSSDPLPVNAYQQGTWTVQQGSPPWTVNMTQVGGSAYSLGSKTTANSMSVALAQELYGTAGTPSANVLSIQGVSGGSNLGVNLAKVGGTNVALGQTTMASSIPVVLPSDQSAIPASESGTWNVTVNTALPTGTNVLGKVSQVAVATGTGATPFFNGAVTNSVVTIKASAGKLYYLNVYNTNTSTVWIQVFDVASGSITLGTTAPTMSFPIPPAGSGSNPSGWSDQLAGSIGIGFNNAINIAVTTTATGAAAPGAACAVNATDI